MSNQGALDLLRQAGMLPDNTQTQAIDGRIVPRNPQQLPVGQQIPPARGFRPNTGAVAIWDAHHYARVGGSQVFAVTNVSQLVLPSSRAQRNLLQFRNASALDSGIILYVEYGKDASATSILALQPGVTGGLPGDQVLLDTVVPQDDVYAFASAAGGLLVVAYSTVAG